MSKPKSLARSRSVGRARKPRLSAWQQLNQGREIGLGLFGNKQFVLGLVIIVFIIGGIILSQGPVFHSYETLGVCVPTEEEILHRLPCGDPFQTIWKTGNFPNNGGGWSTLNAQYKANCDTASGNCMRLSANSTQLAIALSKQPISLDTLGSHEMFLTYNYCFNSTYSILDRFGMYLTRNGTLPSGTAANSYNPRTDVNVALALEVSDFGSGNIDAHDWIQKNPAQTLFSGDTSNLVQGQGTLFMDLAGTQNTNTPCTQIRETTISQILNFTGASSGTSGVNSEIDISPQGGTATQGFQNLFPWFDFQGAQFYVGFYMLPCASCSPVNFVDSTTGTLIQIARMDPTTAPAPIAKPPTLDVGGFFGPLIRALISIGVYIIQNVLSFAVYLYSILTLAATVIFNLAAPGLSSIIAIFYNIVKAILNAIGSIIGISNLGDSLFSLLADLAAAFTTLFGLVIATYGNLFGAGVNFVQALGTILTNYWTGLATWLSGIADFLSLFWSTAALFSQISISMLLSFWLLYGALRFSRSMAGGMEWYHTTGYFMMIGFSITIFFISLLINYLIIPLAHILTAGSTTLGARPKIEVMGTSTP